MERPQRPHEGAVDLQCMQREAMEVAERGIAGAEVIDGHLHAAILDVSQNYAGLADVFHQQALSQFKLQQLRADPRFQQNAVDHFHQVILAELTRG